MKKQVKGQVLWGAGDTIHQINFTGVVNMETKAVEDLDFEIGNNFLDDVLQGVFRAGSQEALRLAHV
jgi:hypothetical protein